MAKNFLKNFFKFFSEKFQNFEKIIWKIFLFQKNFENFFKIFFWKISKFWKNYLKNFFYLKNILKFFWKISKISKKHFILLHSRIFNFSKISFANIREFEFEFEYYRMAVWFLTYNSETRYSRIWPLYPANIRFLRIFANIREYSRIFEYKISIPLGVKL